MSVSTQRIRVALLGCGQIADSHLQEIRKIAFAKLVAVCDVHADLAEQAAARFDVRRAFTDMHRMVAETSPDVVHVTTPAQTHAELAVKLLREGVHVYVEKPFTVDVPEAEHVVQTARQTGNSLCLGHDQVFDPAWVRCRALVETGDIGEVVHVESVLGYPLTGQFGRQVTADANHWVRRLPGGLFQNTLSHPLYRITDFLPDDRPAIDARWFAASPGSSLRTDVTARVPGSGAKRMALRSAASPSRSLMTELTAHLRGECVTGSLHFSTRIHAQRITRVYGSKGALEVDLDAQTVRHIRAARLPGAFAKIETPFRHCKEAAGNLHRNVRRFLRCDIHYFAGMRHLFERFYRSILDGAPPLIAHDEMLRVTRIMDELFHRCRERNLAAAEIRNVSTETGRDRDPETQDGMAADRPLSPARQEVWS